MVIIKYPSLSRRYRIKRKRRAIAPVIPTRRFSLIAYICKAIAYFLFMSIIPLALAILPFFLILIAIVNVADTINRFGECDE